MPRAAGPPTPQEAAVPDEYVLRLEASGEVTSAASDDTEPEAEEAEQ